MLNIYYGRESVDKEKFIYETIMERGFDAASPVIVLVPDQYTLEAERQAFRITGKNAFIGLDVYSISRLGHNVLAELGQSESGMIDKYGRQMLLTGLMNKVRDMLTVYADNVRKPSFIEMVNDYISQLKQYDVTPDMLAEMADKLDGGNVLSMKMQDLVVIYRAYDDSIRGKYTDSEDYVDLFAAKADQSDLLRKAKIWVYGFDSFAPKSLKVLGRLMGISPEVNCVITYDTDTADEDLFSLTGKVIDNLKKTAKENHSNLGQVQSIAKAYPDGRFSITGKNKEIEHLEHELFSSALRVMESGAHGGITVTEAANHYNEAETAASYILHLVRDKKYRYRDIAVICNDREGLGAALERAFDEYSIPCFTDNKRSISGSGTAVYISALISACVYGLRTKDIFRALKTGLGVLDQDETEQLENYSICYKIDRSRWTREFTFGSDRYGEELDKIEASRKKVAALFGKLKKMIAKKQTYREFVSGFYTYLTDDARLAEQLERLVAAQSEAGLRDLSEETMQIWNMIVHILDQINNIMGDKDFDPDEFLQIFTMGLKQAEIGIMPSSPDDLVIGTLQRTRVGKIKALVVVGANEGVIPQGGSSNGLFAEQEEEVLVDKGFEAGKTDLVRREEERLAIYRNFVRPDDELWISYTLTDQEGGKIRPSEIIEDIFRIFPGLKVGRDIFNTDKAEDLIAGRVSTLRHMTDALVREKRSTEIDPLWHHVLDWYRENEPDTVKSIEAGLGFHNRADEIGDELSDIMLSGHGSDSLSVSRLEKYALCPFAYFVDFGLKPEERRIFEAGSREIGDVYHESLMKITSRLTKESLWDSITEDEVAKLVRETLEQERNQYGAGVFQYSKGDSYRADRAEQTIRDAVSVLISHARAGKIQDSSYEEKFSRGSAIPPVEVDVNGKKVYIEGIIDRLDVLENGRVKIIDYKSGAHELTDSSIRAGYTLQLMVYMKAAQKEVRQPAGVFYFYLGTKGIDVSKKSGIEIGTEHDREKLEDLKEPNMKGILINEPETITEVLGDDESGRIASIKKKKSTGEYSGSSGSTVMNEGDFRDLQDAVDGKIREIADGITSGKIDIHPMRKKKERLACRYCPYLGICRFDTAFDGCSYNNVK